MATIPRATVHIDPTASAPGGGDNLICVLAPVATSPDMVPRLFGSASQVVDQHGYSEGAEYVALHSVGTAKPVLFVGMPIGTAGVISRSSGHDNTGSSIVSVAAGVNGVLAEHDGVIRVTVGGTVGTDQIKLSLSLDNGRLFKSIRLGTAVSYVLPDVGVTASFAAGTLIAGDTVLEWHGSAPLISTSDLVTVRTALAGDLRFFRSLLLCGDVPDDTAASAVATQLNAYATSNDRFVYGRVSVPDRLPQAYLSHSYGRVTGTPALTFAEVGSGTDTITRATGSFLADGFVVGDTITVTGTASNNVTGVITVLTALVLTTSVDLADEVTSAATIVGSPTLTFAEVGSGTDTITRSRGSFLVDGFRVGDTFTVLGSALNNVQGAITVATALTLTTSVDIADEVLASSGVTIIGGETKAQWMARQDAEFAAVDAQSRIDISAGRGAIIGGSPYSGWLRRVPAGWYASVREYQHDLHVATWRKDLGPVGADLFDADNELVEWDERSDGGLGSAARFTTLRSWANGPRGAFIALSLTRAGDGQITSLTHNMAVVDAACNAVQTATENVIGRSLLLNADGTATKASLAVIAAEVNAVLELALLTSRGEGPRASRAVWTPSPDDVYNVPEPVMHGVLDLNLNGTVHSVDTAVRIRSGGQG